MQPTGNNSSDCRRIYMQLCHTPLDAQAAYTKSGSWHIAMPVVQPGKTTHASSRVCTHQQTCKETDNQSCPQTPVVFFLSPATRTHPDYDTSVSRCKLHDM